MSKLGRWAFDGCHNLCHIELPGQLIQVGEGVFIRCEQLAHLDVHPENPVFASRDGVLFDKHFERLLIFPEGHPAIHYTVPETVREIAAYAFKGCRHLTRLDLPSGLKALGPWALTGCTQLRQLVIPALVRCLSEGVFSGCSQLETLVLPDGLEFIADKVFADCKASGV